jgi:hypothetical protein
MTTTTTESTRWYRVPEVWLMLVLLAATMTGSLALVRTAFANRDELLRSGPAVATPLPPTTAAHPATATAP